ncbi:hypothetical protein [Streptomyces shenzhenensis]|uniref:hypothetical protein n=1 Tax=Streptomyces shenzhenensis TaxID=943815 RepID=UPI0033FB89E5
MKFYLLEARPRTPEELGIAPDELTDLHGRFVMAVVGRALYQEMRYPGGSALTAQKKGLYLLW